MKLLQRIINHAGAEREQQAVISISAESSANRGCAIEFQLRQR